VIYFLYRSTFSTILPKATQPDVPEECLELIFVYQGGPPAWANIIRYRAVHRPFIAHLSYSFRMASLLPSTIFASDRRLFYPFARPTPSDRLFEPSRTR
jgi:hypothetical protein